MSKTPDIELTCLMDRMVSKGRYKSTFWGRPEIAEAVEMVVDAVDPKIRVLSRYNKRLRGAVDTTWQYVDSLQAFVPGNLQVSRKNFGIDPRVRVLFENVDAMQWLFNESANLSEFFESHQDIEGLHAFLSMEKNEKTILGIELNGDMLKRDVMQTAVTFSDHHILSPAISEQDAKVGIKCCAFAGLLKKVNQEIIQAHYATKELEEKKQRIMGEIRKLKGDIKNTESGNVLASATIEQLHGELTELERDLVRTKQESDSPERHLKVLVDVLKEPEQHVIVKPNSVSLNNLGIKSDQAHIVEYAEMDIGQSLQRVAMVVNLLREDFC